MSRELTSVGRVNGAGYKSLEFRGATSTVFKPDFGNDYELGIDKTPVFKPFSFDRELLTLFQLYNGTAVTTTGLKDLAELAGLTSLDLSYCGVTDAGLKELASLKGLTMLTLTGTKVTNAGLKDFAKDVPKCKVVK